MKALGTIIALLVTFGLIYLGWVLMAWASIFIVEAFGVVVTVSPWTLAVPLFIVSRLFNSAGKR